MKLPETPPRTGSERRKADRREGRPWTPQRAKAFSVRQGVYDRRTGSDPAATPWTEAALETFCGVKQPFVKADFARRIEALCRVQHRALVASEERSVFEVPLVDEALRAYAEMDDAMKGKR